MNQGPTLWFLSQGFIFDRLACRLLNLWQAVRNHHLKTVRLILVPVDLSAASRSALAHAIYLAERFGAAIDVLYVWQPPDFADCEFAKLRNVEGGLVQTDGHNTARRRLDEFLTALPCAPNSRLRSRILRGDVSQTIVELAESKTYDLIVIGAQGRTGTPRAFAGKVAQNTIRHATCPVLTVR